MIKCVLFDLDDTLYDHTHSLRCGLKAVMEKYGLINFTTLDEFVIEHLQLLNEIHQTQVLTGKLSVKEARIQRFQQAFNNFGFNSNENIAGEAAEYYRINYESNRKMVPGAIELINELKKRLDIGIVSNNLVSQQEDKIRFFGLEKYIDVLIVSETAGITKPHPEIFNLALSNLNSEPNEAVMIGDSLEEDIMGAQKAGIKGIWFNRFKHPLPSEDMITQINSFIPIEDVLKLIFV